MVDIEEITRLIEEIRNARADLQETEKELAGFIKEKTLLEDQIEGREDDVKSIKSTIEDYENDLLALTHETDEFGQPL